MAMAICNYFYAFIGLRGILPTLYTPRVYALSGKPWILGFERLQLGFSPNRLVDGRARHKVTFNVISVHIAMFILFFHVHTTYSYFDLI